MCSDHIFQFSVVIFTAVLSGNMGFHNLQQHFPNLKHDFYPEQFKLYFENEFLFSLFST